MKVIDSIKQFWAKISAWFKGASSKVDDFVIKYAPIAINVINWIKEFNESSAADIVEVILKNVDVKYGAKYVPIIRKWLEKNLPIIIDSLHLASNVAEKATLGEKIVAAQEAIKLLPENLSSTTWATLSTLLARALADDNKISISEAIAIIAYVYENNLNK